MIDPRTVGVFIPSYDGNVTAELAGVLISSGGRFFSGVSFTVGVSHVSLVRNMIAEKFLRSPFEWMLCIDADIVPGQHDFGIMLDEAPALSDGDDKATRVEARCVFSEAGGKMAEGKSPAHSLVVAEYSYKEDSLRPVSFGLGFTRIHRSVFEAIQKSTFGDGQTRPWQFMHQGRLLTDFYPSGPLLSQLVPNGEWKGEDHGFFMLCKMAGIMPRIECRTRLMHVGKKGYPYVGDQAGTN